MKETFFRFLKILPFALVFAMIVGTGVWMLNHGDEIFSDDKPAETVAPEQTEKPEDENPNAVE